MQSKKENCKKTKIKLINCKVLKKIAKLQKTLKRSLAWSPTLTVRIFDGQTGSHRGKTGLKSGSFDTPGQDVSSGVPRVRKIRNSLAKNYKIFFRRHTNDVIKNFTAVIYNGL
jgi:hypothetical protein